MERVKRALEYWPILVAVVFLMGVGWRAKAEITSKAEATTVDAIEHRVSRVEVIVEDVQLIKAQMWANARHTGAPVITSIPDGGIR